MLLAFEIPLQWKKDLEKMREKEPEKNPMGLIKERVKEIKDKLHDLPIKSPGLFLRDLHRILSYLDKEVSDPTKQGLKTLLMELIEKVTVEAKKGEYTLPRDEQIEMLESAGRIKDPGKLVQYVSNLFSEKYEGIKERKATLAEVIRRMAARIGKVTPQ